MVNRRRLITTAATIAALSLVSAPSVLAAPTATTRLQGTLADGATWIADVPANWNGTLLLYSHGYTPGPANPPRNSPDPAPNTGDQPVARALLARGYALAGSSYSRTGWALETAADDQLATLDAVQAQIGAADDVIAVGTSMGGLVTGELADRAGDRIDGALATCGLMVGGIDLHNAQLDGLHTLAQLLLPGEQVKLVRFSSFDDAVATVNRLVAAVQQAQTTPQGRARIALAAAYLHMPDWYVGQPEPGDRDYPAQQAAQYQWVLDSLFRFETGRFDVEQSSGGNVSWNAGVNYAKLLTKSSNQSQVRNLYRAAGLNLHADLATLTRTADITADPSAVAWLQRTSTLSGDLRMPILSMHTTDDNLAPVQFQEEYAEDVQHAGRQRLLQQAYVAHPGHCTFTPAEFVTGVEVVQQRVDTGRWSNTTAKALQRRSAALDLGPAAFVRYTPGEFLSDRDLP